MTNLIHIILIIMPMIGVLGGLSLAYSIAIFLCLIVIKFRKKLQFRINLPTAIMLGWFFASCFWSPDVTSGLKACIPLVIAISVVSTIIHSLTNDDKKELESLLWRPLMIGLFGSVIIFMIEYYTNGLFSMSFRNMQHGKDSVFVLSGLDRGCVFLSIISWLVIGTLIKHEYKSIPLLIYIIILVMLAMSDSLAGTVAYVLAGASWAFLYFSKMKLAGVVRICVAFSILAMPVFSFYQNPHDLSSGNNMPDSAKHRLFIWNFAAKKAVLQPFLGHGFGSSKHIASKYDVVNYGQYEWNLLPLHPHNNSLQILLETGLVGLLLFVLFIDSILKFAIKNSGNTALSATVLSCFISYFFVSMISFGMWQTWWIMASSFAFLYARIFLIKTNR
ncbi:MAG: O-antigen ligase family protein [Rickettsiaceae bacterium]|nr:O-antigen ligase family protein [Rickettsiaceae bacterium]